MTPSSHRASRFESWSEIAVANLPLYVGIPTRRKISLEAGSRAVARRGAGRAVGVIVNVITAESCIFSPPCYFPLSSRRVYGGSEEQGTPCKACALDSRVKLGKSCKEPCKQLRVARRHS